MDLREENLEMLSPLFPIINKVLNANGALLSMYSSYSLLLLLWVRLYENVFKVKDAIFTLNHYGSYIFILVHLVFIGVFIPIVHYPDDSSIYDLFYNNIYILFMIIYGGLLCIGYSVYGLLLWRDSKHWKIGKVTLNNRILIMSACLVTLIMMLDIYLIWAFLHKNDTNYYIYRLVDSISFTTLMVGIAILVSRNPANRAKPNNIDSSGSQEDKGELKMDVRKLYNSEDQSNADGIYSNDTNTNQVSIDIEKSLEAPSQIDRSQ
ncbi:hypothetical protein PPL_09114 [Heterostelium album PN500]|uniref:Uncharacterized protein n=1 Tax=Heterostelium pallidum (strain ATCC 26659 / Pp 5 / PN500) TaxID=670386 RepID=D3BKN2_HETP5|nr:hypothetical protein PPL_09114 [Heterostelium album PN500]EFA78462.1 hypothetical protein PPL_09114 [Heterostelium album PN500]|eukprot:XP_020430586.1 hypothetical protein PPL_09114 [Heterostelium album PN500]